MLSIRRRNDNVWLNTAAGALGGLLGSWTMNRFQAGMAKLQASKQPQNQPRQQESEEPATVKAAEGISEAVTGQHLTPRQKKTAEPLVHYGFGTLVGAAYGALAAKTPVAKTGGGTVYGTVVWLLADEIGVPAAGLSKPPREIPLSEHLQALASHLVYGLTTGLTTEGVRRLARRA